MAFSDHYIHRENRSILFNELEAIIRDIDQDVASSQFVWQPTPSVHVQFDLSNTRLHRYIKCRQGATSQFPIFLEAMALLKAPDGCLGETRVAIASLIDVAGALQTLM